MAISLYDMTVPTFAQTLSAVAGFLDKAAAHCAATGTDPDAGVEVRMWDRFFDNYINYPQQRVVYVAIGREPDTGDDCARWKEQFDTAYAYLDQHLAGREWVASESFSLADCSAAPALLYADWTHAIPKHFEHLWAYRDRLLARPSYARALDEARPYRHYFPLGAPEGRD